MSLEILLVIKPYGLWLLCPNRINSIDYMILFVFYKIQSFLD
jgi:hypothetical protein